MKKIKSHLNIYIKTTAAFLSFYLVMMAVVTCVHAENIRKIMQESTLTQVNSLMEINDDETNYLYKKDKNTLTEEYTEKVHILNLYTQFGRIMSSLANKDVYIRATLYDSNDNIVAKTGNIVMLRENLSNPNYDRCIPLDEFMSRDEINNLFSENHLWYIEEIQVTGYDGDKFVIPTKIKVSDEPLNANSYNEITFNPQNIESLIQKEFPKDIVDIYFEKTSESGPITSIMKNRYSYCDVLAKPNLELWRAKEPLNNRAISDNIFIGTYHGVFYGGRYDNYINFGVVYYPFEVAVSQLVFVYILCFIFVLITISNLSNRTIKIFKKQQEIEQNHRNLTSAIAHELKTPLGIIRNYSEGLKENINTDKKDYYLDVIVDETEKMDKMVLEMLNLSKLEAHAYTLKLESFSLAELTQKVIDKYKALLDEKSLNINLRCDSESLVHADITAFEFVISNFISNAIKNTPIGLNIEIKIEKKDKLTTFYIENQGERIPNDKLPKIWDSFYKVDDSRERKDGGTGLGLAIAKNYLELHKAQYGCENTETGVEFWFIL